MNSAGLRSKLSTFYKVINDLNPSIFFIQETKLKEKGKLKVDDYVIFEKLRSTRKNGGGLAIGAKPEFNPTWVREGDEDLETLSIDIFVKNLKIRCCTGYGPQESDIKDKKELFWEYLDTEVIEAKNAGSGLIIQMDGNLWAGSEIIKNDPRPQNSNGRLFKQFLNRNPNLTVVNSLNLCEGLITRTRICNGKLEQSVLDFFIVCNLVLPFIKKMVIDEDGRHILTNYEQVRQRGKATDSDHATEYLDLEMKIITEKPSRNEIWNFKSEESQKTFKKNTSETNEFTNCFSTEQPIMMQIENWQKVLKKNIQVSFKKVRIKTNQKVKLSPQMARLINLRNKLSNIDANKKEINNLEIEIADMEAKNKRSKILKFFKKYSENPERVNLNEVWRTLKKLWPKVQKKIPIAKKNHFGQIISEPKLLKKLLAKEYRIRLRTRPNRPDFEELSIRKHRIFELKLKLASQNKSKSWTMHDLEKALRCMKINRSRDPDGLLNEIFKKNSIGDDLKNSLLLMFNKIKEQQKIPMFMKNANITTVPKRGSRLLLDNERGIFRVPVLRGILMRLIYNENYEKIDRNMSDFQMGGRKNKGCRNNILIINGIIHEVLSRKNNTPVLLQIYDYRQMFDAINLEEVINDAFDVGLNDDNLSLIYNANKEIRMAVNTPSGLTERQTLRNVVLQGDTWSSMLASIQVDKICKDIDSSGYGYQYKDSLPVSMLALVDDLVGVTYAGHRAQQMNAAINIKSAEKRLQFGENKCKSMLIGKKSEQIMNNSILVDKWKLNYLEDSKDGNEIVERFDGQAEMGKTEQHKYLGYILSNKGDNMKNISEIKTKSIWIINKIFNKLKSMNLRKYYFECGIIFLNIILRSSILYASETYYNLKESEIRILERIEEHYLRKLFKTTKGCPISQLYLEAGQYPARFEIIRRRLLFFKNILNENPNSLIFKFVQLQIEKPSKGDWASSCISSLQYLNIKLSIHEIAKMKKNQFSKILKKSLEEKSVQYLLENRKSKGKEINYTRLKMAEYLLPQNENLSIEEQQYIFSIRNRMIPIESNFSVIGKERPCLCGEVKTMKHIYTCKKLNEEEIFIEYEEIFTENVKNQKMILKRFKKNFESYQYEDNYDGIPCGDPLYCNTVVEIN